MRAARRRPGAGLAAAALLSALTMLAACKQRGPVTVSLMASAADLPDQVIEAFGAGPRGGIGIVRVDSDLVAASAAAAALPDLIVLDAGSEAPSFVVRGLLRDLSGLLRRSELLRPDEIDLPINAGLRYDGKDFGGGAWYALTLSGNNSGAVTYNREVFEAAGVPPLSETEPISYDELSALAKKLTRRDRDGRVIVWGTDIPTDRIKYLASDMALMAGISLYADAERTILNDDPKAHDIWRYFARLALEDLTPNVRHPAPDAAGANFLSGRVAIVQLGYRFGEEARGVPDFIDRFGWAPTPVLIRGGPRVTNTSGSAVMAMSARTRVGNQAFEVLQWCVAGTPGQQRARAGKGLPALKGLLPLLPEADAFDRGRKRVAVEDAKYFKPWQACRWLSASAWDVSWDRTVERLVRGQITLERFVEAWYADMHGLIVEGKLRSEQNR